MGHPIEELSGAASFLGLIACFGASAAKEREDHRHRSAIGAVGLPKVMDQVALLELNSNKDVSRRHH